VQHIKNRVSFTKFNVTYEQSNHVRGIEIIVLINTTTVIRTTAAKVTDTSLNLNQV